MTDLIGHTLGQYQIIEQIGRGGMATVFKAYQPNLDRYVALKILPPLYAQQPDFIERFQREAKTIANLNHPHILPIYDFGQDGDFSFLTMRYVENAHTLKQVMATDLTLSEVAGLVGQIAAALDAAHQKGIIHRDVKPSNILIDGEWVLLADFGLARMMETSVKLTGTGVGIGTPAYMSPEQGQGLRVDHHTDIYALGIILFEMLTRQIPHNADTPFGIILKRATEPLPLPRSLNPQISEPMERVILKALAQKPDNRFGSAGAMAEALNVALDNTASQTLSLDREEQPTVLSAGIGPVPGQVPVEQRRDIEHEPTRVQKIANLLNSGQGQNQRNRQTMLNRVHDFWIKGVLEKSLHGAALIDLGLEGRPEAVDHPWQMVLQIAELPQLAIPPGTKIVDVFNEVDRSLLILGEPGSGKTIMLLELTRELISRARQDSTQPMPVVFNLSTWAESQPPLNKWLVEELNSKYYIPKKVARQWVKDETFIPLLDGLDEVAQPHRATCVEAINTFHKDSMQPLVVCSRVADYEELAVKLGLQQAVVLQPLTEPQVKAYLAQFGPELSSLKQALQNDTNLQELVQSPLILGIMTLAYQNTSIETLPGQATDTLESRRKQLFDTYIEQMFRRKGFRDKPYSDEQTKGWLSWLAQEMAQHNQAVFLIERLQPSWLPTGSWRWLYTMGSRLVSGLIGGLSFGLIVGLIGMRSDSLTTALRPALMLGLMGGLAVGLIDTMRFERGDADATIKAGTTFWRSVANVLVVGLVVALIVGLVTELEVGLLVGLIFGLIFGVRGSQQSSTNDIQTVEALSWSWFKAVKAGFQGLIFGLVFGLLVDLISRLIRGQDYAFDDRQFMLWLAGMLLYGVFLSLVFGLVGGLSSKIVNTKTTPNQGIKLTLRNALYAGLLFGLIGGLIVWLTFVLAIDPILSLIIESNASSGDPVDWGINQEVWIFAGLLVGLLIGLIGTLWYGGLDIIQHITLRLILWRKGSTPRNYVRFLDYAVERVFLQKVGGGYIFIHRLLLEHFAELNQDTNTRTT